MENITSYNNEFISGGYSYGLGFSYINTCSNLYVDNLNFYNNRLASKSGSSAGGVLSIGDSLNVNLNCINIYENYFDASIASAGFGGIYISSSSMVDVNKFNYYNNNLTSVNLTTGMAFSVFQNNSTLTDSQFINNIINTTTKISSGTLVSLLGTKQYVNNITVEGNNAFWSNPSSTPLDTTLPFAQGYVVLGRGVSIVNNSKFINNYQSAGVGIALQLQPNSTEASIIDSCIFDKNIGGSSSLDDERTNFQDHGGAICIAEQYNGHAIIRNSNFTNNVNSQGGA